MASPARPLPSPTGVAVVRLKVGWGYGTFDQNAQPRVEGHGSSIQKQEDCEDLLITGGWGILQYSVIKGGFWQAITKRKAGRIGPGSWFLGDSPVDQPVFVLEDTGRLDRASFGKAKEKAILAVRQKIAALLVQFMSTIR
ncbi:hypothetical protein MGYG_05456 [Nannizzia gypsea CBS 118893]|uniref:Uncharacterized protein n=1 Tax=Arthroderma gypseum (strain ATCC MYA-4604 / CBS 118893) TaxID=535722 RepID=E4UW15_ARTGP|nr:hypothetical protein MGYG_05456 [Nannizzia gypsea CBS 118893]EFR02463.1 hypothetical protein MGYG_05456 [Nannizzia gypsea CBS 118893]